MYFALVAWTMVTMYLIYLTVTTTLGFYWVVFCTVSFATLSYFSIGIQQFEIDLFNRFDTTTSSFAPRTDKVKNKSNGDNTYTNDNTSMTAENTRNHLKDDNSCFINTSSIPVNGRDNKKAS